MTSVIVSLAGLEQRCNGSMPNESLGDIDKNTSLHNIEKPSLQKLKASKGLRPLEDPLTASQTILRSANQFSTPQYKQQAVLDERKYYQAPKSGVIQDNNGSRTSLSRKGNSPGKAA